MAIGGDLIGIETDEIVGRSTSDSTTVEPECGTGEHAGR